MLSRSSLGQRRLPVNGAEVEEDAEVGDVLRLGAAHPRVDEREPRGQRSTPARIAGHDLAATVGIAGRCQAVADARAETQEVVGDVDRRRPRRARRRRCRCPGRPRASAPRDPGCPWRRRRRLPGAGRAPRSASSTSRSVVASATDVSMSVMWRGRALLSIRLPASGMARSRQRATSSGVPARAISRSRTMGP